MTASYLRLTACDPIVTRDGRPFGVGQGNRMKGLAWPYPSVVAGSFRTALVKATKGRDFTGDTPTKLMAIPVAGVFPVADGKLYLPAPSDCFVHRDKGPLQVYPQPPVAGGCDFPAAGLWPVMLTEEQAKTDAKPEETPAWWPVDDKLTAWLTEKSVAFDDRTFLSAAKSQVRDHVQLDCVTGAAAESQLFATEGLSLTHLPRFGVKEGRFEDKYADITLSARVEADGWNVATLNMLHPLGGERRLVRWQANGNGALWTCPPAVANALAGANRIRMVLATPAVFKHGWRPNWINEATLTGRPDWWADGPNLQLVGVSIARWKAVSGWSLAEPRGPKPIKRLAPAGGVYFFKTNDNAASLKDRWLQPVSDEVQDRNDGFGLAVWGVWGSAIGGKT
ncbi:MAG TPA: type III-B CRISPR module-associated Cmr3 family protein [Gemmataceae bacterium]|nr:type III-B CRISPR module-associated Cmr3 family protein [Gemmataceae bacterium]